MGAPQKGFVPNRAGVDVYKRQDVDQAINKLPQLAVAIHCRQAAPKSHQPKKITPKCVVIRFPAQVNQVGNKYHYAAKNRRDNLLFLSLIHI